MIIPKSAFLDDLELDQIPEEAIEGPVTSGVTNVVSALGTAVAGKNGVLSAADAILSVKADIGKNSIARMGKDSIQCFPAVFSAAIDTDDAIAIAKMLEKYYASLLVSIYSLRPSVSLKEYNNIAEYLKSIHSNDNVPTNFKKAKHFIGAKESLEDTEDVAEEGMVSDRFMSLASLFDVKVPTQQTMASPLAQTEGPVANTTKSEGGFLASFFGKKQPKDFKPNLTDAIKCTGKAIEKTKWGIIELDKSLKNLDRKYEAAANIIRYGIELATKDLRDLNEGFQALQAMKAIGSKKDMSENMSYSANFNVIFNAEQLRKYNVAMERFVEHYRNEASHHIFNANNDKFAISIGGGTEGLQDTLDSTGDMTISDLTPSIESFIEDDEFCLVDDEPSGLCIDADIYPGTDPDLAYEGLGVSMGALSMDSVNDISLPFKRTQHLLQERLNLTKATEADATFNSVSTVAGNNTSALNIKFNGDKFGAASPNMSKGRSNGELLEHVPTMIEATFYIHGTKKNGSDTSPVQFQQKVNLGVKCMVRQESSEMVINSLIEGSKSSNPIFRFVSWTRGEYGLVKDLMLNLTEVKNKFKNKKLENSSLLNMSKDRKAIDDVSKFAGNRLLPYMTLIVTEYEVLQAAQVTGVDLTNPRNAKAFMDDYYLLGFGIYNSGTKKLSMMYDGDNSFETLSMTYIQSQQKSTMNINKDFANLISMR